MNHTLFLLYPEWQGSGKSPAVYHGALAMARALLPGVAFERIMAPDEEELELVGGVTGLHSIAPRFRQTIRGLRAGSPARILTIGGTCGVEAAPIGYLNERYEGEVAVVWLDAHGDLNTPQSSPSANFHGMVLRTLLGDGPADYTDELIMPLLPQQVFLAGTRDLDPHEKEFIAATGISVTRPDDFAFPLRLVERIRSAGFWHVYVHLDLDVFSPAAFPDTLMKTPGGPTFEQVRDTMRALASSFDVVGASLVEYVGHGTGPVLRLREVIDATGLRPHA